jgi:hypothetical protein
MSNDGTRFNFRVVALDPGGTTGWAAYSANRIVHDPWNPSQDEWKDGLWSWGQIGPGKHHLELEELLDKQSEGIDTFIVVCESFEFRQGKQRANINLMSREYIGVVELWCKHNPKAEYVAQTAGMGKGFVTDPKLRIMGRWIKGQKHARDAMRHLIYYMVNRQRRRDMIKSWQNL